MIYNKNDFSPEIIINRLESFIKNIQTSGKNLETVPGMQKQARANYRKRKNIPASSTLLLWSTDYDLNVNWLLTGRGNMLLSQEPMEQVRTDRQISGSIASSPVPVVGLAACGIEGIEQIMPYNVTASPITLGPRAVAVVASGESMVPAGIASGHLCFCDPDQAPLPGEAVFFRRRDNKGALKLFLGAGTREGYTAFKGWLPKKDKRGHQIELLIDVPNEFIDFIAPVVFIRRRL